MHAIDADHDFGADIGLVREPQPHAVGALREPGQLVIQMDAIGRHLVGEHPL